MNSHFGAGLVCRKEEQNIQRNNKAKEKESSPALNSGFRPLCPVLVKKRCMSDKFKKLYLR